MTPVATSTLAGGSLVVGFAVAQVTGVRAAGGVVLVAALAWCAAQWRRQAGTGAAVGLVVLYAPLFVAAHLLAPLVGAWPAVVLVAVVMGAAAFRVATPTRAAR
ncbi:MAG: hypothetical protein ACLGIG_06305 [Actinomycetes bacterium]